MVRKKEQFDTVIIGLGTTGMSCVRYLSAKGESFAVADNRSKPTELESLQSIYPDVPVYLGTFDKHMLCAAHRLIVSPGVALSDPAIETAIEQGVQVTGDVELFCRHVSTPIIAITGSNGKSTVASLLYEMINASGKHAALGGNIGTPVLDLIRSETPDFYVLELSSFQLETVCSLNAVAAVVLNITEDHMDRYSGIRDYSLAKTKIYTGDGTMVINLDDEITIAIDRRGRDSVCYSVTESGAGIFSVHDVNGERMLVYGETGLMAVSDLPVQGDHNISNCLAALALGSIIGLPMEKMLDVLKRFPGLPHRCRWIANIKGVDWYDDSKGTNVGASCAAIGSLSGQHDLILIAGGIGKGADFTRLADVARDRVRAVILIGRDANLLAQAFKDVVPVYFATALDAAVFAAADLAQAGDAVLLSPACASFDMFIDYRARGDAFIRAVGELERS